MLCLSMERMSMTTYYVDNILGNNACCGTDAAHPVSDYRVLKIKPGDKILFRRGCVFRDFILSPDGTPNRPVFWGAYGEGDSPRFLGSVDLSDEKYWHKKEKDIWECTAYLTSEVCNIIFNGGSSWGRLAWEYDEMKKQGDWYYTHIGFTNRPCPQEYLNKPRRLYLYSEKNPAVFYKNIECALFGERALAFGKNHVVFDNIDFMYSGVHGYLGIDTSYITIKNCGFYFIGGAVWERKRKIRFGNAVELWNSANNITVENCRFDNIYDSCFTTQGCTEYVTPQKITFTNNECSNFGMAAYELRDRITYDTVFSHNYCHHAGMGFSAQSDERPRNSEIYPEPMGHNIFIWRIENITPRGSVTVSNNRFGETAFGSPIYSKAALLPSQQIKFSNNTFENSDVNVRWCDKDIALKQLKNITRKDVTYEYSTVKYQ